MEIQEKPKHCRVYSYGCLAPLRDRAEDVHTQKMLARKYRNKLVEIERERRLKYAAARDALFPGLAEAEKEIAELNRQMEEKRAESKRRSTTKERVKEIRAEIKLLKEAKIKPAEVTANYRLVSKEDKTLKKQSEAINLDAADKVKEARNSSGVYWGTYNKVEDAAAASFHHSKGPPKFVRNPKRDQLTVQLNPAESIQAILAGQSTMVRLVLSEEKGRGGATKAMLWLRIGSEFKRAPKWAKFPLLYHRSLPSGCLVSYVSVIGHNVGTHCKWEAQFTLSDPAGFVRDDRATSGKVSVDMAWRHMGKDAMRVAYWRDDQGAFGEFRIDPPFLSRWPYADELQSIGDKAFDIARDELAAWIKNNHIPEKFVERLQHLALWKSRDRLRSVVWMWKDYRFAGDESIYERMEAWRREDKKLYDKECFVRRKATNYRKNLYRVFARELAKKYLTCVVEDADWRKLAAKAAIGPDTNYTRYAMRIASPGTLRQILSAAFGPENTVPAMTEGTTITCHNCGSKEEWDAAKHLWHTCEQCGAEWDQDDNACRNLLKTDWGTTDAKETAKKARKAIRRPRRKKKVVEQPT